MTETVILADADYVDSVAFQLTVNFERVLGRRIPKADLAQWLVCVALDGGLCPSAPSPSFPASEEKGRAGDSDADSRQSTAVFTYTKPIMQNFTPGDLVNEVNGHAFMDDRLGEFALSAYPVEPVVDSTQFFVDVLDTICCSQEVKRLIVIPNAEQQGVIDRVRQCLRHHDTSGGASNPQLRQVTLLAMQPLTGGAFRQELLGYSLMAALGIRGEEVTQAVT